MTASEKKAELAKYRIKQAEESLEEAEFLLSGKKSPRSIINRAYYAMFYSVLALLVYESYSSSKHSGVIDYFNKRFIKEKVFLKILAAQSIPHSNSAREATTGNMSSCRMKQ